MREILFRGKRVDNGEWVEGAYYHQSEFYGDEWSADYIITTKDELEDNMMIRERVIPETVGQYTGLTDKYGTKIFEGDIVEGAGFTPDDCGYGTIRWDDGAFEIDGYNIVCTFHEHYYSNEFEVIGNIHDNPELLEVDNG